MRRRRIAERRKPRCQFVPFSKNLDAQRTLLQARAQYLRALSELYRTTSDIDRLLGSSSSSNAAPSQP